MVPNAQSNTAAYWMYEDFTHQWLFTAGSLLYVLKSSGFKNIQFLDPKGVENSSFIVKILKLFVLKIYSYKTFIWNMATGSTYHKQSPIIYTWELKVLAS